MIRQKSSNISTTALKLKSKIVHTLKQEHVKEEIVLPQIVDMGDVHQQCQNIIEEIRTNNQIIRQIHVADGEIQQLQVDIAKLGEQYDFVSAVSREDGEDEEQTIIAGSGGGQFMAHRDVKTKLLMHLQSVHKKTKSIDYHTILGLPP